MRHSALIIALPAAAYAVVFLQQFSNGTETRMRREGQYYDRYTSCCYPLACQSDGSLDYVSVNLP
jgi:hypothetical protein